MLLAGPETENLLYVALHVTYSRGVPSDSYRLLCHIFAYLLVHVGKVLH